MIIEMRQVWWVSRPMVCDRVHRQLFHLVNSSYQIIPGWSQKILSHDLRPGSFGLAVVFGLRQGGIYYGLPVVSSFNAKLISFRTRSATFHNCFFRSLAAFYATLIFRLQNAHVFRTFRNGLFHHCQMLSYRLMRLTIISIQFIVLKFILRIEIRHYWKRKNALKDITKNEVNIVLQMTDY